MKNLLLLSLLLAGSTHAIPAPSSPVRQKIGQYITSTSGILPSKERINRLREDTLSSSYGFSKVNEIGGAPITFKFGKTARHQKLRKAPNSGEGDLHKRQSNTSDNESELLNFDNTRYIASITIAGEELDVILDTGSTDTFVYSVQPIPFQGIDPAQLPPLFNNGTAQNVVDTGLTYYAQYGSGNGITTTLGAIQLADVALRGTDFAVTNLTFANLYQSSAATGASGLLGLGFPINGVIWLTILDETYNTTGSVLTREQSELYFPIVPLLVTERHIPRPLFTVDVERETELDSGPPVNVTFDYTPGGSLTLGGYPEGLGESDFTWSPVPVVEFTQQGTARGLPGSTGNRWTTPLEAMYFNGARIRDTRLQTDIQNDGGNYYMLIDTGNPSFSMPRDMMSQITNAWAANPQNYNVPCDSAFEFILQFAGRNFTMSRQDFLVPSYNALDSLGFGGYTTQGCQFQAQISNPTPDELGPGTSITYTAGAPMLRNIITVFDYGNIWNSLETPPRIGLRPQPQ